MTDLFGGIYKGKKVFITGHTGFKGSWLSLWLHALGAEVMGYSLPAPTQPNHISLLKLPIKEVTADILDYDHLNQTMSKLKPDIVFHLAAQALVRDSYTEPRQTFETNVMGTVNVLEACRVNNINAIVNITSDKCYQNQEKDYSYVETDPMGGHDPYSASKGCAELVGNAYRLSFFAPTQYGKTHHTLLADVRAGNVIGGGDWAKDRLVPDCMKAAAAGTPTVIRSPHSVRPWQHVLEPLSGYLQVGAELLKKNVTAADNWNFGPDDASCVSVETIISGLQKEWSAVDFRIEQNPNAPHEAKLLKLDSAKAKKILKWKPVWNKDQTLDHTAAWYKEFYTNNSITTLADLEAYVADAKKKKVSWSHA